MWKKQQLNFDFTLNLNFAFAFFIDICNMIQAFANHTSLYLVTNINENTYILIK